MWHWWQTVGTISSMASTRSEHDVHRKYVAWLVLMFGAAVAAFGVRDIVGFEPLPAAVTADTILEFLDFRRYFGIWPGVAGAVGGTGLFVVGLLLLFGFGAGPLPPGEEQDRSPAVG